MTSSNYGNKDDPGNATVRISRIQDGEKTQCEYSGSMKVISGGLHVIFSDNGTDNPDVIHLLKVFPDHLEWIRSLNGSKKSMVFRVGEKLPFLFETPDGSLSLTIITHSYSYSKKNTHEICVSYSLAQNGKVVSDYKTNIVIKEIERNHYLR